MLSAQVLTLIWFLNALFLGVILDVIALELLTNMEGFMMEGIR